MPPLPAPEDEDDVHNGPALSFPGNHVKDQRPSAVHEQPASSRSFAREDGADRAKGLRSTMPRDHFQERSLAHGDQSGS